MIKATRRLDASAILCQRLLTRIHRRYVTTTQTVRLGDLSFLFTRVADPDRVLDQVAAEIDLRERLNGRRQDDQHLHLPYWAELWDSALAIGLHLVRTPGLAARVLDLGCGMGLAGAAAAALGARVLFADLEKPALLFARLNALPWARRVRTRQLNWRVDRLEQRFDLILGADILYERGQWEYLEPFWRGHLASGGAVLLAEPGRQTGDLFLEWITSRGWRLEVFFETVPTRDKPVRLIRMWL